MITIPNLSARGDLVGIATHHIGHANLRHIVSNTIALAILMPSFFKSSDNPVRDLVIMAAGSGVLYWALGPSKVQVRGASAIAYALAAWWLVTAYADQNVLGFFAVGLAMLAWGVFDGMNPFVKKPGVSVASHLCGFISGAGWASYSVLY